MTKTSRSVKSSWFATPTIEGAGVKLKRAFGYSQLPMLDPFLMLDDFSSNNPADYMAGFPWHPHRGIETITYLLEGQVEHGDSMGNRGEIKAGEVQWMTAGSGIIHQEMPKVTPDKKLRGYQLWANLPASRKMTAPRYQNIESKDIPIINLPGGIVIRLICGEFQGHTGPVQDIYIAPTYMDITIPAGQTFDIATPHNHQFMAYGLEGAAIPGNSTEQLEKEKTVLFTFGDNLQITAAFTGCRLLLISGNPLNEPIAWGGPIVMNTQKELSIAFDEYQNNTFIKNH